MTDADCSCCFAVLNASEGTVVHSSFAVGKTREDKFHRNLE